MEKKDAIRKLDSYIKALKEIDNTKANLDRLKYKNEDSYNPVRTYTVGRFLWPFLAVSAAVLLIVCSIGDQVFSDNGWEMLFIFGTMAGYYTVSILIAKAIQNKKNKALIEEQNSIAASKKNRTEEMIENYETQISKYEAIIEEMNDILPFACQNTESAAAIRDTLKANKAETIEEAVRFSAGG